MWRSSKISRNNLGFQEIVIISIPSLDPEKINIFSSWGIYNSHHKGLKGLRSGSEMNSVGEHLNRSDSRSGILLQLYWFPPTTSSVTTSTHLYNEQFLLQLYTCSKRDPVYLFRVRIIVRCFRALIIIARITIWKRVESICIEQHVSIYFWICCINVQMSMPNKNIKEFSTTLHNILLFFCRNGCSTKSHDIHQQLERKD